MEMSEFQQRAVGDGQHTYSSAACPACGDLDGCHVPGKVKRSRPICEQRVAVDGCMGVEEVVVGRVQIPDNMARFGQDFPKIVCLCGSTRFFKEFMEANYRETMAGNIVLSVGFYPHAVKEVHEQNVGCSDDAKACLDQLHLRKIELADEVLILNVGGYIGESTRRELAYAIKLGKRVKALELDDQGQIKGASPR